MGINVIQPSFQIQYPEEPQKMLERLEVAGRLCYQSEVQRFGVEANHKWLADKVTRGHLSLIEHASFSVKFITNRGVTHEIVRHRLASYSQESTRYCNYGKTQLTFIRPPFFEEDGEAYQLWYEACQGSAFAYERLLLKGARPEQARDVLNNSLKTEILMTANMREWRHFCHMRADIHAHPEMRQLAVPLLLRLKKDLPPLFNDIRPEIIEGIC